LPLRDHAAIVLGHGGGGQLSADLIGHLFVPAFGGDRETELADAAVLSLPPGRVAMTTDAFVVRPLFFPGGDIGRLAVHGTVNDLAMRGARPVALTASFILEEGLPIETLGRLATSMAAAARDSGVTIVAGDTKVVERGHGDGVYITTAGVGVVPDGREIGPARARDGDVVLISGSIGDHGMAIMSVRDGLAFDTPILSDSAPLHDLMEVLVAAAPSTRVLRDPTRGGVAAALNEIADASRVAIELDESSLPIRGEVRAACELLGLDPLQVANEGKLLAILGAEEIDAALHALRGHPLGRGAAHIGRVRSGPAGRVTVRTTFGARRMVPLPIGEQLPRIC
jgi:hydrogenase expression/formation protein HypE